MDTNQNYKGRNALPGAGLIMAFTQSPFGFLLVIPAAIYFDVKYKRRVREAEAFRVQWNKNLTPAQVSQIVQAHTRGDLNLKSQKVLDTIKKFQPAGEVGFSTLMDTLYRLSK